MESAVRSTEAFGPWPEGPWQVFLHEDDTAFEQATGAPGERFAAWVGSTLHLRPWLRLSRRDLGAILRHELVHRRLSRLGWPRWKEEALCLWAENHVRMPEGWPREPDPSTQVELNLALAQGSTSFQRWAYAWLRAWVAGKPLPPFLGGSKPGEAKWSDEISTQP